MKKIQILSRTHELRQNETADAHEYKFEHNLMVDGKIILHEWQSSIEHLRNFLFITYKNYNSKTIGNYHLIDDEGNDLIPYPCNCIQMVYNGAVFKKNKYGFDVADHFENDKMIFKVNRLWDNKENFVKFDGTTLFPLWFDGYCIQKPEPKRIRYIKVIDEGKQNFIDSKTGNLVSNVFFENAEPPRTLKYPDGFEKLGDNFVAFVKQRGRWKVLLANGEIM